MTRVLIILTDWVPEIDLNLGFRQVEENCQKFGKKRRKTLFNLPKTHFSIELPTPKTRVSGTQSITSSYVVTKLVRFFSQKRHVVTK